ncbi:DUF1127 domain-containing protein [Rhizobium sp. NFR07]|uniref:DUF1127 domain-containing protein n=1 Tax=Rhizobium sp. NFR07 TaxID=1566262 RepID=UPI000B898515|nr:DUF1127 domain-containing protein [Rhizobium sp. NFR07]
MDPKLTGHKEVDRPDSGLRAPKDVPPSDRSTTVVGRDLQALRDVLSLHLVDPRRGGAESMSRAPSTASEIPPVRQAAVKAGSTHFLQLYICTPLEGDIEEPAPSAEVPAVDQRAHHFLDVRGAWQYFTRQRELRRQRDQLMLMNDYMLRDIGIENRMEIAGLMRGRRYME